jgi:hypothetical protein
MIDIASITTNSQTIDSENNHAIIVPKKYRKSTTKHRARIGNLGEMIAQNILNGRLIDKGNPYPKGSMPDLILNNGDLCEVKTSQYRLVIKHYQALRFLRFQQENETCPELSYFILNHKCHQVMKKQPIITLYQKVSEQLNYAIQLPFSVILKLAFIDKNSKYRYLQTDKKITPNTQIKSTLIELLTQPESLLPTLDELNTNSGNETPKLTLKDRLGNSMFQQTITTSKPIQLTYTKNQIITIPAIPLITINYNEEQIFLDTAYSRLRELGYYSKIEFD